MYILHVLFYVFHPKSIFPRFLLVVLLRMSSCEFYFIASFIRGSIADSGFCTFARNPYETCKGHPDEKVEKRVQVAKIYGETGNTRT